MELSAFHLAGDGTFRSDLSREEALAALRAKDGVLWVDILDPRPEDAGFLEQDLGFHPLEAANCISPETHVPAVDQMDDHLFFNVHGVNYVDESEIVQTTELSLFVGEHYVVSSHNVPLYSVLSVRESVQRDGRLMRIGPLLLAHALLDALVANVHPTIDKMLEHADFVEEQALRNPKQEVVGSILKLRRSALGLHRVMVSQQMALNRLARGDFSQVGEHALPYFRNVYEQVWRIVDFTQSVRDRSDTALTTYMSSIANRQNESMRVLSMVAAIFLPLTLLAGIYGMNFEHMPELAWPWAYFVVLGFMGIVIVTMVWAFWARRWIGLGHQQVMQEIGRVRPLASEVESLAGNVGSRIYRIADALYPFNDRNGSGRSSGGREERN
ncbi:MAG: magnesium/cobalt transporter CorA [Dehalococcoidia bacterium]